MSGKAGAEKPTASRQRTANFGFMQACCACLVMFVLEQCLLGENDVGASQVGAFFVVALGACVWLHRRQAARQPQLKMVRRPQARSVRPPLKEVDPAVAEGILAAVRSGDFALADERLTSALASFDATAGPSTTYACAWAPGGRVRVKTPARRFGLPWDAAQTLVDACLDANDANRAAEWFKRLYAEGLRPGAKRLLEVLNALVKQGSKAEAEEFFLEVLDAGAPTDTACYHIIFDRCEAPGDTEAVDALLRRPIARNPREHVSAFVALLRSKAQTQDGRQAEAWLNRAVELGVPEEELHSAVIQTCARLGDTDRAERYMERMLARVAEPAKPGEAEEGQAQGAAGAEGAAQPGRPGEARKGPGVAVYSSLMDSWIHQGQMQRAEAWFERMMAAGVNPDAVSFCTILKAYTRGGSLAGAEKWLRLARELRVPLDSFAYGVVIDCAARVPNPEKAEWWLHETIRDGLEPDIVSFNLVLSAWAKRGSAERAQKLVALMSEKGVEPDVVTLGSAMNVCAKAGDLVRAESLFREIVARGQVKPDAIAYNALINAAVQSGDVDRAEEWLAAMLQDGVPRSVVSFTTLLHCHARAGKIEKAESVLERMLANGIEANVVSYSALIQACSRAGDMDRAEKWFKHMQQMGVLANVTTFGALLNVCAKARDYRRAEKWLASMSEHGVQPNVICYTTVIDACAKAGQAERAEMWLRHITGESEDSQHKVGTSLELAPTSHCYTTAAHGYAAQGAYSEVERLFEEMEERSISMNEYSLSVLLTSYLHARPWQRERAEAAWRRYMERGLPVTNTPLKILKSIVGNQRFQELLAEKPLPPGVSKDLR